MLRKKRTNRRDADDPHSADFDQPNSASISIGKPSDLLSRGILVHAILHPASLYRLSRNTLFIMETAGRTLPDVYHHFLVFGFHVIIVEFDA